MAETHHTNKHPEGIGPNAERLTPKDLFAAADQLFDGVDYREEGYADGEIAFRWVHGVLKNKFSMPLIPIKVVDRLGQDSKRRIDVRIAYLLSDGSRVDQSVMYSLREGDDSPEVSHHVNFGDSWGRDIPYEPFFDYDEPRTPLVAMMKALETVRLKRLKTPEEYRNLEWAID